MRPDAFWWIARQSVRLAGWGFHLDKVADGLLDIEFAGNGAAVLAWGRVIVADRVRVAVGDGQPHVVFAVASQGRSTVGCTQGVSDGDRVVVAHLVRRAEGIRVGAGDHEQNI